MNTNKIFENIEKIFRYLIPAFVFTLLLVHFEPEIYKNSISDLNNVKFSVYFLLSGMTIYSFHRVLFEFFDYVILLINNRLAIDHYLGAIKTEPKTNFFYYKMASIHSVLITIELIMIFMLIHWKTEYSYFFWVIVIMFIFVLIVYIAYNNLQIQVIKKLADEIKASSNILV